MRRLKTYPALASVAMPASAEILDVRDRGATQAAALVVSYDDADETKAERRFVTLRPGAAIPPGAQFVASWRELDVPAAPIACLFELADDMPADLPAEAHAHWRVLTRDGFTLRADRAWIAPADELPSHLSREQAIAVATLQEHGYGPVVYA